MPAPVQPARSAGAMIALEAKPRRVLAAGVAYAVLYSMATLLLPRPADPWPVLLADGFLFLPGAVAALCAARAARRTRDAERAFWWLLAGGAASSACAQLLFALHDVAWPVSALRLAAHLGYYGWVVLLVVALFVRPEQPRSLQEARWAALEWAMALVLGYFLVLHMAILPAAARQQPWYGVLLAQEVLPAAGALLLATRGGAGSFQRVYAVMAACLVTSAVGALYPDWLYTQGRYELYSPWEAFWILPMVGVAASAQLAPAAGWLRAPWSAVRTAPRPLVALAVAIPPLVDLLARALGAAPPRLAAQRTDVALAASAVLALLVATRVRGSVAERPLPAADADEARLALGEPNPYLQFTSGLAHELNNPLTAVSGWAELALHAGGDERPLRELLAATRSAADVVQQLQRATRGAGDDA